MFQSPLGCARGSVMLTVPPWALWEASLISPCANLGSLLIVLFPIRKKGKNKHYFFLQNCSLSLHS